MPVNPKDLRIFTFDGRQSMAVPVELDSRGRFIFCWVRAHFIRETGSGTDTASMTADVVSRKGAWNNARLMTWTGAGVSADVFARVHPDEYQDWTFEAGDRLQFNWTNPDSDEIIWGLEVALAPAY